MTPAPTLDELINALISLQLDDVHVAMPGRVVAYDGASQRASVQPTSKRVVVVDGVRSLESLPVLHGVPVVLPGGGGYRLTFPVAADDPVLLVVCSQAIDVLAGAGAPSSDRRHSPTDAVAILGLRGHRDALATPPDDCATLGREGGAVTEFAETEIRIGGAGAEPALRGTSYNAAVATLLTALTAALSSVASGTWGIGGSVAWGAAVTSFESSAGTSLATIAKVK